MEPDCHTLAGMDTIYEDPNIKLLLSRQRTSYRHAHEACKWFGGTLVSLSSKSKQDRVLQVRVGWWLGGWVRCCSKSTHTTTACVYDTVWQ